ncbi:hypothetical protein SAMN02745116_00836 [Pilibacter termitis]|uniref:Uncharacterized protein n=1 Tax=Pilibacter termitis TaxID=263852 RepID=A0A1T4LWJ1_9ENTE|nr:hypothetical protein [Pilibacter termitis]SJZ59055.1 hypothetical protein SAMN02745116_00836 [Pilibacter termitis]
MNKKIFLTTLLISSIFAVGVLVSTQVNGELKQESTKKQTEISEQKAEHKAIRTMDEAYSGETIDALDIITGEVIGSVKTFKGPVTLEELESWFPNEEMDSWSRDKNTEEAAESSRGYSNDEFEAALKRRLSQNN